MQEAKEELEKTVHSFSLKSVIYGCSLIPQKLLSLGGALMH